MKLKNIDRLKAGISEARHNFYSFSIGQGFNQQAIDWLYTESGEKLVDKVKTDIRESIVTNCNSVKELGQYVRLVYYELLQYELLKFRAIAATWAEPNTKNYYKLYNGYITVLSDLSGVFVTELKLTAGIAIREAQPNDFNITGSFYRDISLIRAGTIITPGPEKSFTDYLTGIETDKRQAFADRLKTEFPGIRGKELGVLLKALKDAEYMLLIPREQSAAYDSLRQFFGWNICSNEAINKGLRKIDLYRDELTQKSQIIQSIRKSIK